MKKISHANGNNKNAGEAMLISDKIDFEAKAITRDKEQHYIVLKGSIHQEDTTLANIYAPNIGAHKYIKKILVDIKKEDDSNTAILEDFNTPLASMGRSSRQNINRAKVTLNDTLDKMNLIDIFTTFHPKAA